MKTMLCIIKKLFLFLFCPPKKLKKEIEEYYTTLPPFPLDSRDENNWYDEFISEEDYNLADAWQDRKNENYSFNRAWIETLTLEE